MRKEIKNREFDKTYTPRIFIYIYIYSWICKDKLDLIKVEHNIYIYTHSEEKQTEINNRFLLDQIIKSILI